MTGLQLFDALDAATEAALRASIQRFGVLVPVVKDQDGRILDGHHRSRIADDLDVLYRTDVVQVADEAEAEAIARTLNTDRRHLSIDQRREVVADLRKQGHTIRAIAGAVRAPKSTVSDDIKRLSESDNLEAPDRIQRAGGGTYPSSRPSATADTEPDTDEAGPIGPEQHPAEVAIFKIRDDLRAKAAPVDRIDKACRQVSDAVLGIRGITPELVLDALTLDYLPPAGSYVRDLRQSADTARRVADALDALATGIETTPLRRVK